MRDDLMEQDAELDAMLIRALERRATPVIPADFAARVAAMVPVRRVPERLTPTHYGRNAMVAAMVVVFGGLVGLAANSQANSLLWQGAEWLLCLEFVGLGIWWSGQQGEWRR